MDERIAKVKWFSSARNSGVLVSVGGENLRFTSGDGTAFTAGQVVTYEPVEDGAIVRAEPVTGRVRFPRRIGGRRADDLLSTDDGIAPQGTGRPPSRPRDQGPRS